MKIAQKSLVYKMKIAQKSLVYKIKIPKKFLAYKKLFVYLRKIYCYEQRDSKKYNR